MFEQMAQCKDCFVHINVSLPKSATLSYKEARNESLF